MSAHWIRAVYIVLLVGCAATATTLVALRFTSRYGGSEAQRARLINEAVWTLIPIAVLALLLWKVAK